MSYRDNPNGTITPLAYGKDAAQVQQNIAASMVPSPAVPASLTNATGSPGIADGDGVVYRRDRKDDLLAITPDGEKERGSIPMAQ